MNSAPVWFKKTIIVNLSIDGILDCYNRYDILQAQEFFIFLWNVYLDMQINAHSALIPKPPKFQYNA